MKVRANGNEFKFDIFPVKRGEWIVALIGVNGERQCDSTGPYNNERVAKKAARTFAKKAYKDGTYGWVN